MRKFDFLKIRKNGIWLIGRKKNPLLKAFLPFQKGKHLCENHYFQSLGIEP